MASALTTIGDPQCSPVVFHCTAGKDRTGVLAALRLDILRVTREAVVEDCALTGGHMALIMERLRRDPLVGHQIDDLPPHLFAVEDRTMERFIDLLYDRYGGAHRWAATVGISQETLAALRNLFVTES